MICDDVRALIALEPDDERCSEHLSTCVDCAAYRRRQLTLDRLLRVELHAEAPAELTARLLALIPVHTGVQLPASMTPASAAAPVVRPAAVLRPQRWYTTLVYVLSVLAIGISLAIGWRFYELLDAQLGIGGALAILRDAPALGWARLVEALPQTAYALDFLVQARDQLQWLLMAAVLWAALDAWSQRRGSERTA